MGLVKRFPSSPDAAAAAAAAATTILLSSFQWASQLPKVIFKRHLAAPQYCLFPAAMVRLSAFVSKWELHSILLGRFYRFIITTIKRLLPPNILTKTMNWKFMTPPQPQQLLRRNETDRPPPTPATFTSAK